MTAQIGLPSKTPSRRNANRSVLGGIFKIYENIIFQKSVKKIMPYEAEDGTALQDAVPEGGQIQIVIGFFQKFTKRVFEKKVAKIK